METRELESKLGKFQAAYTPGKSKIVINVILSLIWLFLGFLLVILLWDKARGAAVIFGLIFLVSGAAYAIVPYRRRAGREARLYEAGVMISIRGEAQSWRFDEIDGVRVISGQDAKMADALSDGISEGLPVGGLVGALVKGLIDGALQTAVPTDELVGTDINSFQFFVGGVRAFDIGPEYKRWKELGAAVFAGVMDRFVPRVLGRLAQGEQVVFDGLTGGGFGKTYLTLTQKGIQEKTETPVDWTDVRGVSLGEIEGCATVKTADWKGNITFGIGAPNALVALEVIRAMVKDAGNRQGPPPPSLPADLPTEALQYLDQAYAYEEQDEFEQALRACEVAIKIAPSLAEAHNLCGLVLEELDRKEEAVRAYREAVRLDPEFREALDNLSELESEL